MNRACRLAILVSIACAAGRSPALAQYPGGYGGWGWHGWGGATAAGHTAAGMGAFAGGAGRGAANLGMGQMENSQARSANAQTAMAVNNYRWQCQQYTNASYYNSLAQKQQQNVATLNEIRLRILNNPTESDIANGDALNAIYDEITSPKVYSHTLDLAQRSMPGSVVRRIPFNKASAAMTYSLAEITSRDTVPAIFQKPVFNEQRANLRALAAQLQNEANVKQDPRPETLKKFRAALDGIKATLETITQPVTDERLDAEKYLKALYGLTMMLESPSYDVYLAAVEREQSVPLADILTFMHAFNLRFGVSKDPSTRELYSQLYGLLSDLRQRVNAPQDEMMAAMTNPPQRDDRVTNFYGGMNYQHFNSPPPPGPGGP